MRRKMMEALQKSNNQRLQRMWAELKKQEYNHRQQHQPVV